jgi:TolB protein
LWESKSVLQDVAACPGSDRLAVAGEDGLSIHPAEEPYRESRVVSERDTKTRYPSWSPNGNELAYEGRDVVGYNLFKIDLRSGKVESITKSTEEALYCGQPQWSPAGDDIVWVSNGFELEGSTDLVLQRVGTAEYRRLTSSKGDDASPVWCPCGCTIAFVSWRSGKARLYVMPGEGGDQRELTSFNGEQTEPAWSPIFDE